MLAAEGLFILGYLLAADAPAGLNPEAGPGSCARQQAPGVVAGLIASGAVLAALAVHQVSSAALTGAGLAAAAGAYVVALPPSRAPRRIPERAPERAPEGAPKRALGRVPRRDSDVDVQ